MKRSIIRRRRGAERRLQLPLPTAAASANPVAGARRQRDFRSTGSAHQFDETRAALVEKLP